MRRADAEAEQRDADRQTHREHRAERDDEDDDGGEDAVDLALGELELARTGRRRTRPAARRRSAGSSSPKSRMSLPRSVDLLERPVGDVELGEGDRAVGADLTCGLSYGLVTSTPSSASTCHQLVRTRSLHRRVVDALRRALITIVRRERRAVGIGRLEQVLHVACLAVGQHEVGAPVGPDGCRRRRSSTTRKATQTPMTIQRWRTQARARRCKHGAIVRRRCQGLSQ